MGLNRVFVPATGTLTREAFLAGVKPGRGANNPAYRTEVERQTVRADIKKAKTFYMSVRDTGSER